MYSMKIYLCTITISEISFKPNVSNPTEELPGSWVDNKPQNSIKFTYVVVNQ